MDPKEVDNWIDSLVLWKERCEDLFDDMFRVVDAISELRLDNANRRARRWGEQVSQRQRYVLELPRADLDIRKG